MHNDLAIVHALLCTLSEDLQPEDALKQSTHIAADLTGWPGIILLEPSGLGNALTVVASAGHLGLPLGTRISRDMLPWRSLEEAKTLEYVPDIALEKPSTGFSDIRSIIYIPLTPGKTSSAILIFASDHRDGFDNQDLALAETLRIAFIPAYQHMRMTIERDGYLRTWMASSDDGIILLDNELHVSMLNSQALGCLGLFGSIEDWQNRSLWDLVKQIRADSPDIAHQIMADMHHTQMDENGLRDGEYELDLQTIHWYNFPVRNQQHPLGRILILHNVTENRRFRKIRQRFTETAVSDIQAPLRRLTAALSDIAYGDSDRQLTQESRNTVGSALATAEAILKTINELIDVSQLESGEIPLSPSAFSFPDLVESVVQEEQPLAEERHLTLVKYVDQSLPLTWGDHHLIQQVLQHVIDNALKVTPPGGSVQVTATVMPQYTDKIRVSVSDKSQSNLRCNQDRNVPYTRKPPLGQGSEKLWLAFCRSVLQAHGERLWVSCPSSHGITVTFTLPKVSESLAQLKTFS